ncbi:pyrimidine 5'-nucleotidase [Zoogloea sp.]|uniref:pyrimidine 5'-nucleotidase n=1 Tax=Zoogloea sp. TaxID=49181 RepID=UPI00261C0278|nr:pyrimidine 5'-nucleotidase [Zoogloea sp.]MDD3353548.1 pyrimidine 5'-nucleotidase [Zoogloea sp.]
MPPTWLFDLDNTLHNASPHIFPHINRSMTDYLMRHLQLDERSANRLRVNYWHRYGATLTGLMRHHGTRPEHFLHDTHQFPELHRMVVFNTAVRHVLRRLPGKKIVFSNGPRQYAEAVLDIMGVRTLFADVFAVEQMRYHPKPRLTGFQHLIRDHRLNPRRCILVEDSADNLRTAKRLGMKTVWISRSLRQPDFVDCQLPSVLGLARHGIRTLTSG